ncbi:hypothetical protein L1987_32625 [Smallanthus sonchifolius]|uniref:Uncharacterized protein n=1 Tax=Smallanthus sonchifolius TaxID=185202 RepID=A0ACB9HNJ0_9ASTR|nr:hypothetical protein L1987_32625 [Smallanthus sonchifolius]
MLGKRNPDPRSTTAFIQSLHQQPPSSTQFPQCVRVGASSVIRSHGYYLPLIVGIGGLGIVHSDLLLANVEHTG